MRWILVSSFLAIALPGVLQDVTGSIEGTITNAYTGDPIRDIQVSIASEHTAITDRDGKFKISKIPPGEYVLSVSQHGYFVPNGFTLSNSAPVGSFKVQPREQIRDVQFEMTPSGTISGRVWKSNGTLTSNAGIQVLQYRYSVTGEPMLNFLTALTLSSNDKGEYRQWGLPSGKYFVLASPPQSANPQSETGMIPTFYTNSRSLETATPVIVERGKETEHIDITLLNAQRHSVTVNLSLPSGVRTVTGKLRLIPDSIDSSSGDLKTCIIWTCVTAARSQQTILDVLEGRYTAIATAYGLEDGKEYSGRATVYVGNGMLDPITIVSSPVDSFDIKGHVRMADTGEEMKITAAPIDLQSSDRQIQSPRTATSSPGIEGFVIKHVPLGQYEIGANSPPGTYLVDVLQGGRSILNGKLVVGPEPPESIDIILGRDGGTVRGLVRNSRNTPIGFAHVVLVPMSRNHLLTQTVQADYSGKFSFENVAPGAYELYSWLSIQPGAWANAELMKQYEALGTTVTIAPQQASSDVAVTRIVE
jgi:hypothetical protein